MTFLSMGVQVWLHLDLFVRFLRSRRPEGELPATLLSRPLIEDFYLWLLKPSTGLRGQGRSKDTARKVVEVAQLLWRWAEDSDRWPGRVPRPKRIEMGRSLPPPPSAPTWAEMDGCIAAAKTPWIACACRESFLNLDATSGTARYAPDVVNAQSKLVDMTVAVDGTRTAATSSVLELGGGADGGTIGDTEVGAALADEGVLDLTDLFNLLVIPPPDFTRGSSYSSTTHDTAAQLCFKKNAMYLVSSPDSWTDATAPVTGVTSVLSRHKNAALFFPRLSIADPLQEYRSREFGAAASIAGLIARTDGQRGFWKAPAGLEANLRGVTGLSVTLTDMQQGKLNQQGINAVRVFPGVGAVNWGARTLVGNDAAASEWKYLPVRRVALNIKESLYRGTKWAVFEPNDERL